MGGWKEGWTEGPSERPYCINNKKNHNIVYCKYKNIEHFKKLSNWLDYWLDT